MAHFDDAIELVGHAKQTMITIKERYDASLNDQEVKPALLIEIKNLLENLRSALDFTAHGLFAAYGSSKKTKPRIYFPYALLTQNQAEFQSSNQIEGCIPGLTNSRPDIASRIDSYQHYSDISNRWLPLFMELNNENKHRQLTPQTRQEQRGLRIESGGASMQLGPGASMTLGPGASMTMGGIRIGGAQTISGNSPAHFQGAGQQTVIVWVSFAFGSNGEEVISFLQTSVAGVDRIVSELSAM